MSTKEQIVLGLLKIENKILLVKEAYGGHFWTLPGGVVEPSETFTEALIREFKEETGLEIQVQSLILVKDRAGQVCLVFKVGATGGKLLAEVPNEIEAIKWFDPASVKEAEQDIEDFARFVVQQALQNELSELKVRVWPGRNGLADLFI